MKKKGINISKLCLFGIKIFIALFYHSYFKHKKCKKCAKNAIKKYKNIDLIIK